MTLAALSLAWVAGIFFGSLFSPPPLLFLTALVPLPLLMFRRMRKAAVISCLSLILAVGGMLCYQSSLPSDDASLLIHYNDSSDVVLRGTVSLDPDVRDKTTRLKLSVETIEIDGSWQSVSGMVMLYVPRYPSYSYGDFLEVSGSLETPQNFEDFDYQAYLAKQSVHSVMLYPRIELLSTGGGFQPLAWIYGLRHALADILARTLPEPQASLAQGIVLGLRGNISDEVNSDFARSGITHVLAISGANLTIIAGLLSLALGFLIGKRFYLYVWLTMAAIWFYTVLSGASPPVMRAAIMASLFLITELLGRQKNAGPALCLAAAVMVAFNPMTLWDVSFQLSVLSMAGIVFLYPPLFGTAKAWISAGRKNSEQNGGASSLVLESLVMTLSATLAVWPASAAYFGIISLAAPLATLLAVPSLAPIMITSILSAFAGLLYLPLAQVIAWAGWLLATYLLLVARMFSRLPYAAFDLQSPAVLLVIAYYACLISAAIWLNRRMRKRFMAEMEIV